MKNAAYNYDPRAFYGDGVMANQDVAMKYPWSIYCDALILHSGLVSVEMDIEDALYQLRSVATWGHLEALFNCATKCLIGDEVLLDRIQAAMFFRSVASRGNREEEFNNKQLVDRYSIVIDDDEDIVSVDNYSFFDF